MKNNVYISLIFLLTFINNTFSQEYKIYDLFIGKELRSIKTRSRIIILDSKYSCDKIEINANLKHKAKLSVVHLLDSAHVIFDKLNSLAGKKSDTIDTGNGFIILNGYKKINRNYYFLIVLINDDLYLFKESKNKGQSIVRPENISFLENIYFQINNKKYNILELKKSFVNRSLKTM